MATISSETVVKSIKKGSTKHCCWGNCPNDSRYPNKQPSGTYFIRFPKPGKVKESMTQWEKENENSKTEKAKKWVHACSRKGFTITSIKKDTYICSNHFIGGSGPTDLNPNPYSGSVLDKDIDKLSKPKRKPPKDRGSLPPKKPKRSKSENTKSSNSDFENIIDDDEEEVEDAYSNDRPSSTSAETEMIKLCDSSTQTEPDKLAVMGRIDNVILKNELNLVKICENNLCCNNKENQMDMNVILKCDTKAKYFIGLTTKHFWSLYNFLGKAKFNLNYWNNTNKQFSGRNCKLSVAEQLFVTLLRLRRGFNIFTLAHLYQVSEYTIRTIFTTWIMFLFQHFKSMESTIFPERQTYRATLPKVFRPFKNIRASIDCTEFKCEMPRNYSQQGNLYSSYKSNCTMKCLIAVNPNGAACFVSDLFEGSISDVEIFQQCGIMQHINPNDSFLVDKGFTVQHLLLSKQATIFIPPFLGSRDKFTKEELMMLKRIAKARIHVERFNERLKQFRLLDKIIPLSLAPLAFQLVYVGCMLVNFQEYLCK